VGQIIPRSMLSPTEVTAKIRALANELKTLAAKETNTSVDEWLVRDILPKTDLGFNTEKWLNQHAFSAADTWEKDWDRELDDNTYVCFYGVALHALNPTIYGIKFKAGSNGATTIDTIQFQKLKMEEVPIGLFDRIIYRKEKHIYVELIADTTTPQYAEEFEILGMLAEPYGEIVSGPTRVV